MLQDKCKEMRLKIELSTQDAHKKSNLKAALETILSLCKGCGECNKECSFITLVEDVEKEIV